MKHHNRGGPFLIFALHSSSPSSEATSSMASFSLKLAQNLISLPNSLAKVSFDRSRKREGVLFSSAFVGSYHLHHQRSRRIFVFCRCFISEGKVLGLSHLKVGSTPFDATNSEWLILELIRSLRPSSSTRIMILPKRDYERGARNEGSLRI